MFPMRSAVSTRRATGFASSAKNPLRRSGSKPYRGRSIACIARTRLLAGSRTAIIEIAGEHEIVVTADHADVIRIASASDSYEALIRPVEPLIAGAHYLIVIPDPSSALIPITRVASPCNITPATKPA